MSVVAHPRSPAQSVDALLYWSALVAIAAAHGLAILFAAPFAGLTLGAMASGQPAFVITEMLLVALLLWPAVWLTIRRLHDRRTPGWLALPAILLAALVLMMTAFGRPFAMPSESPALHFLPLLLIVLVSACVIVEGLGVGRRDTHQEPAPVESDLRLAA